MNHRQDAKICRDFDSWDPVYVPTHDRETEAEGKEGCMSLACFVEMSTVVVEARVARHCGCAWVNDRERERERQAPLSSGANARLID